MPTPYKVLSRPSEITPPPTPEGSGSIPASGYGLVRELRDDAADCARPDRAALLLRAADEIERLIAEIKTTRP